jgi:serine/threonine protein kinase/Tol biopolymer transport system component
MTSDRWRRVEDLCHAALARASDERAAFLAQACAGDDVLQREVESLIAQDRHAAGFMSVPAVPGAGSTVLDDAKGRLVGQRLGVYAIRSLLGVGGMGEVYRAHDDTLGREVAIKVLPSAFTSDPERRARFEREARMLATLNHPNIGAIYGVQEADGVRALVLELVEGETLAERIASNPSGLPISEALGIARQIVDALEAAHEKGIVHRDLKPANIIIQGAWNSPASAKATAGRRSLGEGGTPTRGKTAASSVDSRPRVWDGTVKVLDFGLAKAAGTDGLRGDGTESRDGAIFGTAAYMSPEQARGQSIDKRGDIWAFGCVLYEMLTGQLAFPGDTVSDTIVKILEREPDWPALPAATPASIRRLLPRCLAKDPKQRLRDVGDVRIELDAIVDGPAFEATAAPAVPVKTRMKWLPWIALTALAGVVGVREAWRPMTPLEDPLANAQFSRFTDWEGTEGAAEISPDGRFVAFVADHAGEFDLWLKQVGTGDFKNLTANIAPLSGPHPLLRTFGFSGDGAELWFTLAGDPIRERKILIPLTGGTSRAFLDEGATSPSWSSDANRLVFFRGRIGPDTTGGDPLFLADRTGGDARQILAPEKDVHNHNPVWSPDDQWLYFVHGFVRELNWTDEMDVWRLRPSGGSPERLTHQNTAVTFLAPLNARTLLYVARGKDGSGPWLWALDVESRITRRVNSGLDTYTSVAASRDGRRVVATIAKPAVSLWTVPILGRQAEEADVQRYPVTTARALAPRFGGTSLFFLSARGTGDGLWRFQDGQAFEVRKGTDGPLFEPPAVSRDGNRVAVVLGKEGKRHLAIMSADGTGLRGLAESIDIEGTADWSPDGASIVTGGSNAQGPALFMIPVDGGAPVRLVAGQAVNPVWSPDGNLIVYAGALVPGQIAPLLGVRPDGAPVQLPPVRVSPGGHRFLPDGRGLVYLPRNRLQSWDFWLLDLATGNQRQLTRLSNQGALGSFDLTPDGKHIVFNRARDNSDIVLIDLPKAPAARARR